MSILLLSTFVLRVKAVCCLGFIYSLPNLTENTFQPEAIELPKNRKSGSSCPAVLPSRSFYTNLYPYTHLDWILCQLSSPEDITGPAGMALNIWIALIMHSFRDIKGPSALLKRPEMHHNSSTGLLWMIELNSSFIINIHWTK